LKFFEQLLTKTASTFSWMISKDTKENALSAAKNVRIARCQFLSVKASNNILVKRSMRLSFKYRWNKEFNKKLLPKTSGAQVSPVYKNVLSYSSTLNSLMKKMHGGVKYVRTCDWLSNNSPSESCQNTW
jgi:hypothetical protein